VTGESAPAAAINPPPLIPDHRLDERIGRGGYGEVWLARSALGARRAVKVVWRNRFDHAKPFEREFHGIERFEPISRQHDALVDILQAGRNEEGGWFYYVMELADPLIDSGDSANGTSGSPTYRPRTLQSITKSHVRLPVAEIADLGARLADGLAFLHRHELVHRDIKPANILFIDGLPKLADVGLVARIGGDISFVGTEGYIAPEGPGTPAADIFALGLVLYEAATGQSHHDFPQLPATLASSPEAEEFAELNAILLRACHTNPRERYGSAAQLRDDLRALTSGRSVRKLRELERRVTRLRNLGAVVVICGLVATAGWWWQQRKAAEARAETAREAAQVARLAEKEHELRLNLYAADMSQAGVAVRAGNLGRARELLRLWEPQPGNEDVRDAVWSFVSEAARGNTHRTFRGHARNVAGLALSPDGAKIYSAGFDGTLREWDIQTGHGTVLAEKPGEPFYELVRLGERDFVLGGGSATWRWRDGQWTSLGTGAARHLAAADDWVACGGKTQFFGPDEPVEILALDGSGSRRKLAERSGRLALSKDGRWIATGDASGVCAVYSTANWERSAALECPGQVVALAFSPDGRWLAGTLREGGVVVWDLPARKIAFRQEAHDRQVGWCLAFSPDSRWLATGGSDQSIHIWNIAASRLERVLRGHEDEVWSLAFAPDGRSLASSGKDETVRVWPLDTPETAPLPERIAGSVLLSPDGRWMAAAEKNGPARVFAIPGLEPVSVLGANEVPVHFSGSELLTTPRGQRLNRWDIKSGRLLHSAPLADAGAVGDRIEMSSDGRSLAMVLSDGRLAVWSAENGQLVHQSTPEDSLVHELAFSPDHQWLATSHNDFTIRLVRIADWKTHTTIHHHKMRTAGLVFSPSSDRLASASWDGTAALFRVPDGQLLHTFRGHTTSLQDVAFVGSNQLLAVLEGDASVAFWDLRTLRSSGRLPSAIEESNHNLAVTPDGSLLISTRLTGSRPGVWRTVHRRESR
jgi:WD40 repeat protein